MQIEIKSTNPRFLDILQKNPETFNGVQLKKIKNGAGIGHIVSPNEYHLVFQDTKYSFSEDTSNQIDFQSYCNPRVVLDLISEFLRHTLVEKEQWFEQEISWLNSKVNDLDVKGFGGTIRIENIYADSFSRDRGFVLQKYFPEIDLEWKSGCIYTLTVTTPESLHRLLNLTALTCMYMAATNRQHWYLNRDLAKKYIRVIKNLTPVPYFVLYLFAKRCIKSREDFAALRDDLASAYDGELNLVWGSTQEMRLQAIGDRLLVDGKIPGNVYEVGCGEMDYPNRFLGKLQDGFGWVATDKEDYGHLVSRINRKHHTEQLRFVQDKQGAVFDDNVTILLIEVIEHMPYEEAIENTADIVEEMADGDRLIISTPNKQFNKHFGFDREFRHDDHHFELTPGQFEYFVHTACAFGKNVTAEFFGIGDEIEGDHVSLGAVITRRDNDT